MAPDYDRLSELLKIKDDQAFKTVYENTKRGVFSIIAGMIRDKATVEDLMQDYLYESHSKYQFVSKGRNFRLGHADSQKHHDRPSAKTS